MEWEESDVNELLTSADIKLNNYIEIRENEAVAKIRKKWLLVDQIVSFAVEKPANRKYRTS